MSGWPAIKAAAGCLWKTLTSSSAGARGCAPRSWSADGVMPRVLGASKSMTQEPSRLGFSSGGDPWSYFGGSRDSSGARSEPCRAPPAPELCSSIGLTLARPSALKFGDWSPGAQLRRNSDSAASGPGNYGPDSVHDATSPELCAYWPGPAVRRRERRGTAPLQCPVAEAQWEKSVGAGRNPAPHPVSLGG